MTPAFPARIAAPLRLVVAGSAGAKVRSAARLAARAAVLSGLRVTQRDDYPVTVQTGHCVSSLVLSPDAIHHSGIDRPDVLVVLSAQGAAKVAHHVAAMSPGGRVFVVPGVTLPATRAAVTTIDPGAARPPPSARQIALHVLSIALAFADVLAPDALVAAAASAGAGREESTAAVVRAALATTA